MESIGGNQPTGTGIGKFFKNVFGNEKLKVAQEAKQASNLSRTREKLVFEFHSKIFNAAKENKIYNVFDGVMKKEIGPIEAEIKRNQDIVSIICGYKDPEIAEGRVPIIQLDIDMTKTGKEIRFIEIPYDSDEFGKTFSLSEKEHVLDQVAKYVKNFRQYDSSPIVKIEK